ncbi:MAG TPA: PEGA domain-containing protein [Candidatus Bathyarchaeia archaeon]|nr:PEGA domain-containing protein [Candidatus Bathyarchaeia archaeon]
MSKRVLISLGIIFLLLGATSVAIKFAKGYRLDLKKKKVTSTGLLVANSSPKGAQVFINDKLTTATDDTLNLPPDDYRIKLVKDGYISWEKTLKLEKELVVQTNTRLFPAVPDLKGLTFSGALNMTPSPDGHMLSFSVASASARLKNGLWILEMANSSSFSFAQSPRQIAQTSKIFDFSQAKLYWSPDSKEILARTKEDAVLLQANQMNKSIDLRDVTAQLSLIVEEWEEELKLKQQGQWEKLPEEMQKIASDSAKNVYFSPDEEKIMYTATANVTIPQGLIPSLPASNTQPETRTLEPGKIYVYDLKEDRNFYLIASQENKTDETVKTGKTSDIENRLKQIQNQYSALAVQQLQWFPTSQHLILTEADKIIILEYDNTNRATVYAGPFANSFVYPWPDTSRLLILASLNPDSKLPLNLYAIELK